uniref:carboxylesterase n=1 Tax=Stomoxys calcitrans TaxID=35570 RepID=A0A454A0Q8_STOCA
MSEALQYHEITLPVGQLKGVVRQTIYEETYYSFEGIPYGQPPVGHLRFRAPLPAEPWNGVKDCTDFNIKPMQKNPLTGKVEGSEDCLYLNVYAKTLQSKAPLPVMVWIYGGSFLFGEATRSFYSPDYFMSEDVIVVTLNYRLCSLGFLSVADPTVQVPGNAGLKDQILALKWVKNYIEYFNGDPHNITLFGNSAGAASTHFLAASHQTKNLFHKAICLSGTMLNSWSVTPPKDYAFRLAQQHGYRGENLDSSVIEFLRTLEPGKLVTHNILNHEDTRNGASFPFGPCIEPYDSEHCVICCDPKLLLKGAWSNDIPIIFSGTADEGLLMYPKLKAFPTLLKALTLEPERLLPLDVRTNNDKSINLEMAKRIARQHFGEKEPSESALKEIIYYYTIKLFWHGIHRSVLSRLAYANAPTYLYRFAFDSPTFNHHRRRFCEQDVESGVAHADDISYLWYAYYSWKLNKNSKEYQIITNMIRLFVNFAKNSQLDVQRVETEKEVLNWRPLDKADPYEVLDLEDEFVIKTQKEKDDLLLWDELYEKNKLF